MFASYCFLLCDLAVPGIFARKAAQSRQRMPLVLHIAATSFIFPPGLESPLYGGCF